MSDLKFFEPNDPDTGFLCNFYRAPFLFDGVLYPTVEHAYQASKFENAGYAEAILNAETPRAAKELGQMREISIKPNWEIQKHAVMLKWVAAKFCLSDSALELPRKLLATVTQRLVENSPTDDYWGIGINGAGANHLGRILMAVRDVLLPCEHDYLQNQVDGDARTLHELVVSAAGERLNDPQWDPTWQAPGLQIHILRGPLYGTGFKRLREMLRPWLGVKLSGCWAEDSFHAPQLVLQPAGPEEALKGLDFGWHIFHHGSRRLGGEVQGTVAMKPAPANWREADEDLHFTPRWRNLLPGASLWSLVSVSVVKTPYCDETYNPRQYFQPAAMAISLEFAACSPEGVLMPTLKHAHVALYAHAGDSQYQQVLGGEDVQQVMLALPYGRPWELLLCSEGLGALPAMEAAFAAHFAYEGIELPADLVVNRKSCEEMDDGIDGLSGWLISVAFGEENGHDFMDMDSNHRGCGLEYLRFHADGRVSERTEPIAPERLKREGSVQKPEFAVSQLELPPSMLSQGKPAEETHAQRQLGTRLFGILAFLLGAYLVWLTFGKETILWPVTLLGGTLVMSGALVVWRPNRFL